MADSIIVIIVICETISWNSWNSSLRRLGGGELTHNKNRSNNTHEWVLLDDRSKVSRKKVLIPEKRYPEIKYREKKNKCICFNLTC